jgi:cytoskeletal protein RodZ
MSQDLKTGVGEKLRQLRVEKKLTLEDVHRKTKIPLGTLEAIEEGRFMNIRPVYIKGFLKIYCDLLGVKAREYISKIGHVIPEEVLHTQKEKQLFSRSKKNLSLFYKSGSKIKKGIFVLSFFILVIIIFRSIHVKRAVMPLEEKKNITQTENQRSTAPISQIKVGIRAKEDCWVKATIDGKVVFQSILRKGRFETWQAKDKIELSLGNAGGIDLEVNDRVFSPLGRRGQIIRRVLINKEGLQVLK